jgi:hypothetical protein
MWQSTEFQSRNMLKMYTVLWLKVAATEIKKHIVAVDNTKKNTFQLISYKSTDFTVL